LKHPNKWIELEKGFSVSHVRRILKKKYGGVNTENAQFKMVVLGRKVKVENGKRKIIDRGTIYIKYLLDELYEKAKKSKKGVLCANFWFLLF